MSTTGGTSAIDVSGKGVALSHKFRVLVGKSGFSLDLGHWSKADGLEVGFDLAENRAGDDWNRRLMAVGLPKYPNLKLARAATKDGSKAVKKWLEEVAGGKKTSDIDQVTVEIWDARNQVVNSWLLRDPVPVKWKIGGSLDAKASGVLLEELEIAYDGFLIDDAKSPGDKWGYTNENVGMQMRFLVDVDGIDLGGWSKCTGIAVDFNPFKREEGGVNNFVYWLGDRVTYDTVKLTRVMNAKDSPKVQSWLQKRVALHRGNVGADMFPSMAPGTLGKVTLLGPRGGTVMSWTLMNVTPKKWTGPELSADGKGMAMETLELNHEGFL
jgi:phage tail-like protein